MKFCLAREKLTVETPLTRVYPEDHFFCPHLSVFYMALYKWSSDLRVIVVWGLLLLRSQ